MREYMKSGHIILLITTVVLLSSFYSSYASISLTFIEPSQNQLNVIKSSNIVAIFSDTINSATVNDTSMRVNGSASGAIPGVYSITDSQVTFNPSVDIHAGEVVTVTLTKAIKSDNDSALSRSFTWQFTVKSEPAHGVFLARDISDAADGASCVHAIDVDSDGDIDVLSASATDDKIAWYENDGLQNFTEHAITTIFNAAHNVHAADLDSDGDMDVLAASIVGKIAWYENDGAENFSVHGVDGEFFGPTFVWATMDLTGDGHCDIVSGSYGNNRVVWFRNDGTGNFYGNLISNQAIGVTCVTSADADGNGAIDLFYGSSLEPFKIVWFRNDGTGTFDHHYVTINVETVVRSIWPTNLFDEPFMGVLSASEQPVEINLYKFGGPGPNPWPWPKDTVSTSVTNPYSVCAADIDGDGDMDPLSASKGDNTIAWYRQDTLLTFTKQIISDSALGAQSVYSADMDGDGDMDVLSASFDDDRIVWYENVPIIYSLTYSAGPNGIINGTSPQTVGIFNNGESVEAVPDPGYHFVNWSDGSTANPRTDLNITAAITVTANFEINTYTLTYTAGANGAITGTSPQTVNHGSNGTEVTAAPATGYHFVNWSDGSTANPRTDLDVMADISVTANFEINTYTLTYTAGANGTITGISPQPINHGSSGTPVTAAPATGYHFVNWSDGSTTNPRTDLNVTTNISVTANFEINTYTLTYTAGPNGAITGISPQTVNYGSSGTAVTSVPDTGYKFVNWSDGRTDNPRNDTLITADLTETANFDISTGTDDQDENVDKSHGIISVPNPVQLKNGHTDIYVTAGSPLSEIQLLLFDALGNSIEVLDDCEEKKGSYRFRWNLCNAYGRSVAPGMYKIVARLQSKDGITKQVTSLIGVKE